MLQTLFRRLKAPAFAFVVVLISAIFILQFGTPSSNGCNSTSQLILAEVHGTKITDKTFRAAYRMGGFENYPAAFVKSSKIPEAVLQGLVDRELLAREARKMGYAVNSQQVMNQLVEKGTAYLTLGQEADSFLRQGEVPVPVKNKDGEFDLNRAKRVIENYFGMTVPAFSQNQVRESLAFRAKETVLSTVSLDEQFVWDRYKVENEKVQIKYVRVSPEDFKSQISVTEEQLSEWQAANEDKIKKKYESVSYKYKALPKQVLAKSIFFEIKDGIKPAQKKKIQKTAEKVLKLAKAGKDFSKLAQKYSDDEATKDKSGDLGWREVGRITAPLKPENFELEPGQVSELIETEKGYFIIKVEKFREGDVPEKEAHREIAKELYIKKQAEKLAKQKAEELFSMLQETKDWTAIEKVLSQKAELEVESSREFSRLDTPFYASFDTSPLIEKSFALAEENPIPEKPIVLGEETVVYGLEKKIEVKKEDFTEEVSKELRQNLLQEKEKQAVASFIKKLREKAEAEKELVIHEERLQEVTELNLN